MTGSDLFFLRTGSEEGPFVLVRLLAGNGPAQAESSLVGPDEKTDEKEFGQSAGDLTTVLREADEYANLHGYDLRIDLNGQKWPDGLGILGNK